jgi:hypothetical protein
MYELYNSFWRILSLLFNYLETRKTLGRMCICHKNMFYLSVQRLFRIIFQSDKYLPSYSQDERKKHVGIQAKYPLFLYTFNQA